MNVVPLISQKLYMLDISDSLQFLFWYIIVNSFPEKQFSKGFSFLAKYFCFQK